MRILLALDSSAQAMAQAVALAKACEADLTALFVLDDTWNVYIGHDFLSGSNARAGFLESIKESEYAASARTVAELRAQAGDFPVEVKTAVGNVTGELLAELSSGDYSMLVMAHPFRRGLEVVRDATSQMVKDAPCTVVLAK